MNLQKTQQQFTYCVMQLIQFAYMQGYKLTFGDAFRDERVHGKWEVKKSYSSPRSVHKIRLAVDFNLFVDNEYIEDGNHTAYQELGKFWKSLHTLARWGYDFPGDANHFSFEYWGSK